jgi:hypothetical protein
MRKTLKYASPGLVLGAVAIVIAMSGTSIAGDQAQTSAALKQKARATVTRVDQAATLPPQATNAGVAEFTVSCPAGTNVLGGGATLPVGTPSDIAPMLTESGPQGNGWHVRYNSNETTAQSITVSADCLKAKLKVK